MLIEFSKISFRGLSNLKLSRKKKLSRIFADDKTRCSRKSFYKNRKNLENLRNFLLLKQYIGASFKHSSQCLYCWLWRNVNDRLCVHFYWMVSQETLWYALNNGYMTTLFVHVIRQYRFTDHLPHWVRQGLEGAFSPVPSILHAPKKINQSTTGFSANWNQSTVRF